MKRWVIGIVTVLYLFLTGAAIWLPVQILTEKNENRERLLSELQIYVEKMPDEMLLKQKNLAKWYNYHLNEGLYNQISGQYDSVLNIYSGFMGVVYIPKLDFYLPICHEESEQEISAVLVHDPQSPFPIGGRGNHSVLICKDAHSDFIGGLKKLQPGDTVLICILDEVLAYSVDRIGEPAPRISDAGEDLCSIIFSPGDVSSAGEVHIRCVRSLADPAPAEEIHNREFMVWHGVWIAFAAAMMLPFFCWVIGRVFLKNTVRKALTDGAGIPEKLS